MQIRDRESIRDQETVVVTGGSAGIGRATAVSFAKRGWNVALLARGRQPGERVPTTIDVSAPSAPTTGPTIGS